MMCSLIAPLLKCIVRRLLRVVVVLPMYLYLIDSANAVLGQQKLDKIIGEYEPGYIYGNVKTHKKRKPSPSYYITNTDSNLQTS